MSCTIYAFSSSSLNLPQLTNPSIQVGILLLFSILFACELSTSFLASISLILFSLLTSLPLILFSPPLLKFVSSSKPYLLPSLSCSSSLSSLLKPSSPPNQVCFYFFFIILFPISIFFSSSNTTSIDPSLTPSMIQGKLLSSSLPLFAFGTCTCSMQPQTQRYPTESLTLL